MKAFIIILLIFVLIILSGCNNIQPEPKIITVQKVKLKKVKIPENFIFTKKIPKPKNIDKQSDVAIYIIDLWNYADKCRSNMISIKKFNKGGVNDK